MSSVADENQLDRIEAMLNNRLANIEARLQDVEVHLGTLNGRVAENVRLIGRHDDKLRLQEQTAEALKTEMYGRPGHEGLVDDVRALLGTAQLRGTITIRAMWTAIGVLTSVSAVVVSLVLGLTA